MRKTLVAGYRSVGEQANRDIAQLGRTVNDVDVAGVHEIGAHADIDGGPVQGLAPFRDVARKFLG
jgi:hypothetical protein